MRHVALFVVAVAGAGSAQVPARPARLLSDPATLFGPQSYPPAAIRAAEQGRTTADLAIAANGTVTDCVVRTSSGSVALDVQTCRSARLARFLPAKDARGRAIATRYTLPVRWVLPIAGTPWSYAAWSMGARLSIDGTGAVKSCVAEFDGPAPREDGDPCATFGTAPPPIALALRGGAGGPTRDTVVTTTLSPGDMPPVPGAAAGKVTALGIMRLAIDPAGRVSNCRVLTTTGYMSQLPPICSLDPGPFAPLPAGAPAIERVATVTITVSNPGFPTR